MARIGREQSQGSGPDPRALIIARQVQAESTGQVYLFGSRARGDWRPDSDIDIMIIEEDPSPSRLRELASFITRFNPQTQELYQREDPWDWVPLQVFHLTPDEFEEARRAPTHLAGGVQRDGVSSSGCPLPPVGQTEPWPAVRNFLRRSFLFASLASALHHEGDFDSMASALDTFHTFELVLKAYASALGYDKADMMFHSLSRLLGWIRNRESVVDFTHTDPRWCSKMMDLRKHGPYEHGYQLFRESEDLLDTVQQVGGKVVERTLQLCHKTSADVGYAYTNENKHYPDINLNLPWGGLELAEPHRFSTDYQREQGLAEGLVKERSQALLQVAKTLYGEDAQREMGEYLQTHEFEDWPTVNDLIEEKWAPLSESRSSNEDPDEGTPYSTVL